MEHSVWYIEGELNYREVKMMQDQSYTEIIGICGITAMGIVAMLVGGDMGTIMTAPLGAALGAIIAHVYHTKKEG